MKADITVSSPVARSGRVLQLAGMFDVPIEEKTSLTWHADLPIEEREWNVGLVTGPSGSGKSTLARHLWPDSVAAAHEWPQDGALVDGFPEEMGIREITGLLGAAGLSSPPAWLRPYRTLSNGEAFRADIARSLAELDGLVVVDEFTSVVDRQVAQVASHAVQKAVRGAGRQLIAVTCHYDVLDWLQPDWAYDVSSGEFTWRLVQPHPPVTLVIRPAHRSIWRVFARTHYLSADIHRGAQCFVAWAGERPVAFTSYLHFPHAQAKDIKMAHRVVVLPDWQGLGIAGRLSEWAGERLAAQGYRYRFTTAHPALIHYMARSPRWRLCSQHRKVKARGNAAAGSRQWGVDPRRLATRSFEYAPLARPASPLPLTTPQQSAPRG
jgi:GNAT superfamily N-acetyltransferase/ABC-type thiamine transport system ATPase subunit